MTGVAHQHGHESFWPTWARPCDRFQRATLVNLRSRPIQCDEAWAFVYATEKNAPEAMKAAGKAGDTWTWVAMDADSKLIVYWLVGVRDAGYATVLQALLRLRPHPLQPARDPGVGGGHRGSRLDPRGDRGPSRAIEGGLD